MTESIKSWLALIGWGPAHLQALLWGCCLSTAFAHLFKYPVRKYCDRASIPLPTFRWIVRTIGGAGAQFGTWLSWPERGRMAVLAGFGCWALMEILYRVTGPYLAEKFPKLSSDILAQKDDSDEAGA